MRPPKVLFVMEGGGWLAQDFVRGQIYQELFRLKGISANYVGYHFAPPDWILRPRTETMQILTKFLGVRVLWWKIFDKVGKKINHHRIVQMASNYDAIVLVKVSSLNLVKQIRQSSTARLVYDLSDAVWLPLLSIDYPDIREILCSVDAVTWDYKYTMEFAKQYNKNTFPWLPASQVELFDAVRNPSKPSSISGKITLGWLGSFGTLFNLYEIWVALEQIFEKYPNLHLRLLGTGSNKWLLPHFENVSYSVMPSYSSQQMIEEVLKMDIGLFPLFDVEDSRVRGFLKALVYMSGHAAVIASPRGEVTQLIQDGVNGMLANSTPEWVDKLEKLITNQDLRQRIAAAGLQTVRRDYSLQNSFNSLLRALNL